MAIFQKEKLLSMSHPNDKIISIYKIEETYNGSHEIKTKYECYGLDNSLTLQRFRRMLFIENRLPRQDQANIEQRC